MPWAETIIYELHVRGFTQLLAEIPEASRGTCAGLAHPAAIAHLTRLGITTVELMPIAAAIDERHLPPLGLTNAWLYNPAALFVPDPRLAPGGIDEVAACVAALHAAGIEVVLDVVLNHTGESDALGPTVSLRGLDNATYYRTVAGDPGRYVNDTGCGNTLALDRPPVLRLAMDALRYYAAAGVDGFRFDLATTLGRRDGGFDPAAPLLQAIAQDPLLRDRKLIAEPWDLGPGGYRLGAFPAEWGEWNDSYRDTVRRFWRGDAGLMGALATRLAGSGDIFTPRSRPPSRSVNFVTAHDGFTLADLVSYATKHNAANGEDNRDGTDANHSWNHGVEGATDDPAIREARRRDVRSLLATLLLSRGTPMLAMGDELGRSQQGNNNTYAQDNPLAWVDWDHADHQLAAFTGALIALRKRHAALRFDRRLTGAPVDASGIPDVEWRRPDGNVLAADDWARSDNAVLIAIFYAPAMNGEAPDRVAMAINGGPDAVAVQWPAPREGYRWRTVIDTSLADGRPGGDAMAGESGTLGPRSVTVLTEGASAARRAGKAGVEPELLAALAAAAGIAPTWDDVTGRRHVVPPETTHALLAAMGLGAATTGEARDRLAEMAANRERRRLPPVCVMQEGAAGAVAVGIDTGARGTVAPLRLTCEDGTEMVLPFPAGDDSAMAVATADGGRRTRRLLALPPLPVGYHTLTVDGDASSASRLIVAPPRCYLPPELRAGGRRFGVAAHLYALRRRGDQGIGDFTTLRELAAGTARAGGVIVGINPLHALFSADRERASPYHPSDRRFLDPIYIDVERAPDLANAPAARELLATDARAIAQLSARATVDYSGVWDVKRAVLDACFTALESRHQREAIRCSPSSTVSSLRGASRCGNSRCSRRSPRSILACHGPTGPPACAVPTRRTSPHSRSSTRAASVSRSICNGSPTASSPPRPAMPATTVSPSGFTATWPWAPRRTAPKHGPIRPRVSRAAHRSAPRPIRSPPAGRSGTFPPRFPRRSPRRATRGSASSSPPTCDTRARCGSIMQWASRACSGFPTAPRQWTGRTFTIRRKTCSRCWRSKAIARAASSSAKTWARCPPGFASGSLPRTSFRTACCGSSARATPSSRPRITP